MCFIRVSEGWGFGLGFGCRVVSGAQAAPKPSVLGGGGGGANRTLSGEVFVLVVVVADIVGVAVSRQTMKGNKYIL
jgi:hypothetical protein